MRKRTKTYETVQNLSENQHFPMVSYSFLRFSTVSYGFLHLLFPYGLFKVSYYCPYSLNMRMLCSLSLMLCVRACGNYIIIIMSNYKSTINFLPSLLFPSNVTFFYYVFLTIETLNCTASKSIFQQDLVHLNNITITLH